MSITQRTSEAPATTALPMRTAWLVLVVVVLADIMDLIDSSIANLAGPSIRADLGSGQVTVQWVLSAYTAAFALGLVTSGRLGDLLGRRRLFLLGMTGFTLASLACGLAPHAVFLIVARTVQGLCGSVMIPQGLALVKVVFPPQHLRKALTPVGPLMGLTMVAGPILAGWLLHLDLFGSQWRSIFLINVPFGVAAAALAWRVLPRRGGEDPAARLDLTGVGLLTAASALLIVPLIQGRDLGWPAWTYVMMAAAVVLLGLFVVSQRHSAHPVITPSLFRKRSFVVGLVIVAGFYASLSAFVLVINLLLQQGLHWTPLHTGLTLIPWALGTAVAVLLAGAVLAEKLGRTTLHLGLAISVVGLLALWWSVAHWGTGITVWNLAPALLFTGFGSGLVFVPLVDFIIGDATPEEVGTGAGLLNAVQQFAGAIGVAALGTVFFARAGDLSVHSCFAAAELVFGIAAGLSFLTLLLVGLLPKHAQQAHG
ncbi:DHA2 family efflux MFS transporter permease subunit [Streptomyces sp. NBC_00440]|uniref:DHA2 family efflux MFS transporter permease subunit n=1 Tax=unclassified Streptomyces TaxID=2593676 RepID=UPI00224E4FBF|nr:MULTISPECIES: DHA2 family efflux MFS transporter permease subunit [unclassified Streptomyces]MCX4725703.1 DHA2 family efflux MFS transporter permease subunit [Streptomyces sp. NBC_01306]WSX68975.1 DHA2 family efflux MFS transporter permease subunit [Streptomyces sp. NBC_00932]